MEEPVSSGFLHRRGEALPERAPSPSMVSISHCLSESQRACLGVRSSRSDMPAPHLHSGIANKNTLQTSPATVGVALDSTLTLNTQPQERLAQRRYSKFEVFLMKDDSRRHVKYGK